MHFILYLNTKNKINYIDETMNEKKKWIKRHWFNVNPVYLIIFDVSEGN